MSGFSKLHGSITRSSVWGLPDKIRIVWVTMLAMADRDGVVEASVAGLAHEARVDKESCKAALGVFSSPDEDSRTKDYDGRRIAEIAGGWRLLNYEYYREKMNPDEVKEKNRIRQARWRERHKVGVVGKSRPMAGEPAYVKAMGNGASAEELDRMSEPRARTTLDDLRVAVEGGRGEE